MCVQDDNLRSDCLVFLTFPLSSQDVGSSEQSCPAPFYVQRSLREATGYL